MSVEVVGSPKDFAQERFVEHVKILHTENCMTIMKDDKQILLKTKDEVRQLSTIGWLVDSLLLENSTTCDFVLDYSWRFIDPYELIEQ